MDDGNRTRRTWVGLGLGASLWIGLALVLNFTPAVFAAVSVAGSLLLAIGLFANARRWKRNSPSIDRESSEPVGVLLPLPAPQTFHSPLSSAEATRRLRRRVSLAQLLWHLTGTMTVDGVVGAVILGRFWGLVRPASVAMNRNSIGVRGSLAPSQAGGTDLTLAFTAGGRWQNSYELDERRYLRQWLVEVFTDLAVEGRPPSV